MTTRTTYPSNMPAPKTYATMLERIEANCVLLPWCGCWIWMGSATKNYGKMSIRDEDGVVRSRWVHRVAYETAYGVLLSSNIELLHQCHTHFCCNPEHLAEGSRRRNVHDQIQRGTHVSASACKGRCYWCRQERIQREQYGERIRRTTGA